MPHDHCEICGSKKARLLLARDEAGEVQAVCEPCFKGCAEGWTKVEPSK